MSGTCSARRFSRPSESQRYLQLETREPGGQRGLIWFNAGYFPTLDDIAKIALLYQNPGEWGGRQILHRGLTTELLAGRGALSKSGGAPISSAEVADFLPEPFT